VGWFCPETLRCITPIFNVYLSIVSITYSLPITDLVAMATSWQLSNSYKSSSVSPTTLATYFLYIVYLISIDLESSRLFNSHTLQSLHLISSKTAYALSSLSFLLSESSSIRSLGSARVSSLLLLPLLSFSCRFSS